MIRYVSANTTTNNRKKQEAWESVFPLVGIPLDFGFLTHRRTHIRARARARPPPYTYTHPDDRVLDYSEYSDTKNSNFFFLQHNLLSEEAIK